jgi:hypothetical protein
VTTIDPNDPPPPSPEVDALTTLLMRHRDAIMTTGPTGVREVRAAELARRLHDAGWRRQVDVDAEWRQRVREHLGRAALAALRCVPDGEIRVGCVVHDGAAVRERLRLGYLALTRQPAERDSAASATPGVTPPTPEPLSAPHASARGAERASASEPSGYERFVAGPGERDVIDLGYLSLPADLQAAIERHAPTGRSRPRWYTWHDHPGRIERHVHSTAMDRPEDHVGVSVVCCSNLAATGSRHDPACLERGGEVPDGR